MTKPTYAWMPDPARMRETRLTAFLRFVGVSDIGQLRQRSDANPEWFWEQVIRYKGLRFARPYQRLLTVDRGMAWPTWFQGATGNVALSCLDVPLSEGKGQETVILWQDESGREASWTYSDLNRASGRLANALARSGLRAGDPVGLFMPNVPEFSAAVLALAKLGAVAVPLFTGLGPEALATRLSDVGARMVLTADGSTRRGKPQTLKSVVDAAIPSIPSVRTVLVLRHTGVEVAWDPARDRWWHEAVEGESADAPTAELPAEHPLVIAYTSGTTGKPKGVVHSHMGLLTKVAADYELVNDLRPGDRIMWPADPGWLGGTTRTLATTLAGACNVLLEGLPDHPGHERLWQTIQRHRVNIFGFAPTLVRSLMQKGAERSMKEYDLSSLRHTASVGEPWDAESWQWCFEHICRRTVPILNCTGGTEIGGYILGTTLHDPLKPCAFGGAAPAMGADIFNEQGKPVALGEAGELVLRHPSIGLTRGLHGEPEKYLATYFERFAGVWNHGDLASRDEDGLWYIHGRADDTIKLAGKRVGPAEIEGLLLASGKVSDSAAVGVPDPLKGNALACVCVPAPGQTGSPQLAQEIATLVATRLGAAFRPRMVLFVGSLPVTRTQKVMRRVAQAVLAGQEPGDLSSLANPEAVDELRAAADRECETRQTTLYQE